MDLAKAIKLVRTASGIKQRDLALSLGVTPNYMCLVENGRREPSISFLRHLAEALGVPVSLFFLWTEEETPSSSAKARELVTKLEALYLSSQRQKPRKRRRAA